MPQPSRSPRVGATTKRERQRKLDFEAGEGPSAQADAPAKKELSKEEKKEKKKTFAVYYMRKSLADTTIHQLLDEMEIEELPWEERDVAPIVLEEEDKLRPFCEKENSADDVFVRGEDDDNKEGDLGGFGALVGGSGVGEGGSDVEEGGSDVGEGGSDVGEGSSGVGEGGSGVGCYVADSDDDDDGDVEYRLDVPMKVMMVMLMMMMIVMNLMKMMILFLVKGQVVLVFGGGGGIVVMAGGRGGGASYWWEWGASCWGKMGTSWYWGEGVVVVVIKGHLLTASLLLARNLRAGLRTLHHLPKFPSLGPQACQCQCQHHLLASFSCSCHWNCCST